MGSIDVPDSLAPEVEYLAVGKGKGRAVSEVVEGDHAAEGTVGHLGGGGRSQEEVHGSAFVRLHMPEGDPPQGLDGENGRDRLTHFAKHVPRSRVEQERLLRLDQELVEGEPGGSDVGDESGQAEDVVSNLVNLGLHSFRLLFRGT